MVKSNKLQEFENFSREEIQKDPNISANEIIRKAQNKGIGIQRKKALEIIRKIKGKKKKPHAYKYTPKKYRKRIHKIKKEKTSVYGNFGKYLGRMYVKYFDNSGEYQKRWITTGTYPEVKYVYEDFRIYEKALKSEYDVNSVISIKAIVYERKRDKFIPIKEFYLR
ncbi:MAG: hypothetical protein QW046_04070 [Candidatus Micrarchaeaceae archaeon]